MVENSYNVKVEREPTIVAYDADIYNLMTFKRHNCAFFGQVCLVRLLFVKRYDRM